tara:strand:- start:1989 stop:3392 length:1404 start_codon:yes stop_codon:yes gene_type:complete
MDVVTRFAPSPTGILHIGGARTALFNWLYARHHGGKFLLRLEDTDRKRSTEEAVEAILDGLCWLDLQWDGEVVRQSERADRHVEIARQLLAEGKAYHCYCTPEELAEMRETARQSGSPVLYDGRWRDRDPGDAPAGIKPTIRIKAPLEGDTVIEDLVQGSVTFANEQLDDMVLLRGDETPTYMHSVVVDDHDMGVTHIIRGDDHLNNAARQKILFDALGWETPEFAHIPLIHGPDGAKMSKRHGAIGVAAYREDGYLPEAMRNYLVRLGWSHGDDELFTTEQAIEWFDLDHAGRGASRFDFDKLQSVNSHYIQQADDNRLVEMIRKPLAEFSGRDLDATDLERLSVAMPEFKKRGKTILQIIDNAKFIVFQRPIEIDGKGADILTDDARLLLQELKAVLGEISDWELQPIENAIRNFATSKDVKLGKIAQPIRVSLTGTTTSPGIFDLMLILGREESIGRIGDVTGR